MTRKQATIAVRSGLNDDEQYGCVVPPIHLSSTYNFIDFNQPRAHDYSRRGNPTRDVVQRALAELEGGAGAVMTSSGMSAIHLVCTTFLSPALQQPLALGADLVVHSCTKYLNGHSDVVAGAVIAKDPELAVELAWWANNIGVTGAAFDSYLLLRGLRTLSPRMAQQQRNADEIVRYLEQQPLVKKLYHPSLPQHPGHEIARRQQSGFGAMLSFELDGDEQVLRRFLSALELFTLAESLGGVESLISHAATMTHAGMVPEARTAAGITDSLLRISVGIEDSEDLIADLDNAFQLARPR